jgi:nucleoside phosphorylase
MSSVRNTERPIFLHFLNREAAKATLGTRTQDEDIRAIDVLTICHASGMSVNVSQMIEYTADKPQLVEYILALNQADILKNTSNDSNTVDFIQHRQKIYEKVPHLYPMYFDNISSTEKFQIHRANNFSMTTLLRRDILDSDVGKLDFYSDRARDVDIKSFKSNIDPIQKAIFNSSGFAITRDNVELMFNKGEISDQGLSSLGRILSARYFHHYASQNRETTATGITHMAGFIDDNSFFPHYDVPVLFNILEALGWAELKPDNAHLRIDMHNIYGTEVHRSFVKRLNSLIFAYFTSRRGKLNTPLSSTGSEETMRRMLIHELRSAIGDRRKLEKVDTTSIKLFFETTANLLFSVGLGEAKINAEFRTAWEQNMPTSIRKIVLLVTATDREDSEIKEALKLKGYGEPTIVSAGQSYAQKYSQGDQKVIFHARSSAGSIGDSGSELVVSDAIRVLNPDFVIASGICFGLNENEHALGDVLVSTHVADYEMIRESEDAVVERGPKIPSGTKLLSASRILRGKNGQEDHAVRIGLLLSGLKLVDSKTKAKELLDRFPDALGGDMEASGLMAAASRNGGVEWIVVKAICDWAHDKDKRFQEIAAKNASNFATALADLVLDVEIET